MRAGHTGGHPTPCHPSTGNIGRSNVGNIARVLLCILPRNLGIFPCNAIFCEWTMIFYYLLRVCASKRARGDIPIELLRKKYVDLGQVQAETDLQQIFSPAHNNKTPVGYPCPSRCRPVRRPPRSEGAPPAPPPSPPAPPLASRCQASRRGARVAHCARWGVQEM